MEAGAANGGLEEKKDSRLIKGHKDVVKSTELTTSTRQTDNHYPHNNSVILSDGLGMLKEWGQEKSGAPAVCGGGAPVCRKSGYIYSEQEGHPREPFIMFLH